MTQKLLLAESLDLLRQCEQREYDVDRTKARVGSNNSYRSELGRLLQSYDVVYQQYVRGIEILNYVRHMALADTNPKNAQYTKNLSEFCVGKMNAYMTRCDNIVKKTDHILLPIEQVDLVTKEGYTPEDTVYLQDGMTYPLSRKEKVMAKEFTVTAGTYIMSLKNRDDYTLAAPDVDVSFVVLPQRGSGLEPSRVDLKLPCQCGWRKVVGVVDAATVQLEIRFSGIRDAHVDVLFQKYCRIEDVGRGGPGPALSTATFDSDEFDSLNKRLGGGNNNGHGRTPPPPGSLDRFYNSNQNVLGQPLTPQSPANNYNMTAAPPAAAAAAQQQQPWMNQLPALPDDELATLASYNVPNGTLPQIHRRPPGAGGASAAAAGNSSAFTPGSTPASAASPPADDPWAQLEAMRVPYAEADRHPTNAAAFTRVPDPVTVNPAGMTCRQRLDRIHGMMDVWPTAGVTACALPGESQKFVQAVYGLPMPRELSE